MCRHSTTHMPRIRRTCDGRQRKAVVAWFFVIVKYAENANKILGEIVPMRIITKTEWLTFAPRKRCIEVKVKHHITSHWHCRIAYSSQSQVLGRRTTMDPFATNSSRMNRAVSSNHTNLWSHEWKTNDRNHSDIHSLRMQLTLSRLSDAQNKYDRNAENGTIEKALITIDRPLTNRLTWYSITFCDKISLIEQN